MSVHSHPTELRTGFSPSLTGPVNGIDAETDNFPVRGSRLRIEIGLVNNMPDTALLATERQFTNLLQLAAGELDVRLRLFSLAGIARGEAAQAAMDGRYADVSA